MPQRDIALALSGGGHRAAYFNLGVLRKLHELDLLNRVAVISSVSGGSIVAGAYAQALAVSDDFDAFFEKACDFLEERTIDVPAVLRALLPWTSSSRHLERVFGKFYRNNEGRLTRMSDLSEFDCPRFVFNATAVHNGRGWRFISGGAVEEWELGQTHDAAYTVAVDRYAYDATLAKAVTASTAFPVFSAVTIPREELRDIKEVGTGESRHFYQELTDPVRLSDGGVRDNTGLTSILAGHQPPGFESDYFLIGSDAGSVINRLIKPPSGRVRKFKYLMRQFEIRGHHNNRIIVAFALREHRMRRGSDKGIAMLRIDEPAIGAAQPAELVGRLSRVSTRLKSPGWNVAQELMNHGADLLWARVSEYTHLLSPEQMMPHVHSRPHKDED